MTPPFTRGQTRRRGRPYRGLSVGLLLCGCAGEYDINDNSDPEDTHVAVPPVAIAGPGGATAIGTTMLLDGRSSYDPDGEWKDLQLTWKVLEQPVGGAAELSPQPDGTASIGASIPGTYRVGLVVTDRDGAKSELAETAARFDAGELLIELTWDAAVDLDLHMVQGSEGYFTDSDCYYANPTPQWGAEDTAVDDPSLDLDDTDGHGPEFIRLQRAPDGTQLELYVSYHQDRSVEDSQAAPPSTLAEVSVHAGLDERFSATEELDVEGQVWFVGTLDAAILQVDSSESRVTRHEDLGAPEVNKTAEEPTD